MVIGEKIIKTKNLLIALLIMVVAIPLSSLNLNAASTFDSGSFTSMPYNINARYGVFRSYSTSSGTTLIANMEGRRTSGWISFSLKTSKSSSAISKTITTNSSRQKETLTKKATSSGNIFRYSGDGN